MSQRCLLLVLFALIAPLALGEGLLATGIADPPVPGAGTITGTVVFTGPVPPDQKLMTTDGAFILHNDLVVDPKSKGLRYVAVTLKDARPQPKRKDAKPVVMDQKDMLFLPRVIAVQHGQPVLVTNSDLCNHSVLTATKVEANQLNTFTPFGSPIKFTFVPQEKPILVGCSLHAWMRAWIYVVEHPWFDVTDAQGKFTLRNLPPGNHTLDFHHADTGKKDQRTVELLPGKTVQLKVEWQGTGK